MASNPSQQMLPHSVEAERAVLGVILHNPEYIHLVISKVKLRAEHFFVALNRAAFSCMLLLDESNKPIDVVSLSGALSQNKRFSEQGKTYEYLAEISEQAPLGQNSEYYANIIRHKYYLRRIITACSTVAAKAVTADDDLPTFVNEIEREFLDITNAYDTADGLVSASKALIPTLESLEQRINFKGAISGIPSGFMGIDEVTGGWQKSDLIILAARPGMGKTALALNWVVNASKSSSDMCIAVFTLEMSRSQLLERLLSAEGKIDSACLRRGSLDEKGQEKLMQAARTINEMGERIIIDETPAISVMDIRSRCRRLKREKRLDMVVIDYLQLMSGSPGVQKQGREREISEISMGLKGLAKELEVPVIAAAQLNRGPDSRPDKRPRISDLRESGSMEQDADQILFIYRDDYYNPNSEMVGKAEIMIAKNRHGNTSSTSLAWLPKFVSFHNLSHNKS